MDRINIATITEYYETNRDKMVNTYSKRLGSREDAEDVVQQAFCNALQYQHTFDPGRSTFSGWFHSTISNCVKDLHRQNSNRPTIVSNDVDGGEEEDVMPDNNFYDVARECEIIVSKISKIKKADSRLILRMYYLEQYKPGEIASATGFNIKNIKQIVWRFKGILNE